MQIKDGAGRRPCSILLWAAVLSLVGASARPGRAEPSPLAQILAGGAEYVANYEREFSSIVSEEDYVQRLRTQRSGGIIATRRLRSDVLLTRVGGGGWVAFRDVFEADGRAIRDRESRLEELFLKPGADSDGQAKRITEESARFNLGHLQRTINVPTLALTVLRTDHQPRSRFDLERLTRVAGREVAQVKFVEVAEPRVVSTPDNASAEGRLWIEPASGRVVKTEFTIRTDGSESRITVTYGPDQKLAIWVPVAMSEDYVIPVSLAPPADIPQTAGSSPYWKKTSVHYLDARATYSRFRQFGVTADLKVDDR